MHSIFSAIVGFCMTVISAWNFPQVLGFNNNNNNNNNHGGPGGGNNQEKIDLLVNGVNDPVGIVDIDDFKPGDNRIIYKDLYVNRDAKIYLHLKDVTHDQGEQTEPEMEMEAAIGPKSDIENYTYYDLKIKNKVIIDGSLNIPLPDAVSCWIPLGKISKNKHTKVEQSFHFDITVGNWAQGDSATFTEEFLAVAADNDMVPETGTGRVWDPGSKKCVPKPSTTLRPSPTVQPTPTIRPTNTPRPTRTPTPTVKHNPPPWWWWRR